MLGARQERVLKSLPMSLILTMRLRCSFPNDNARFLGNSENLVEPSSTSCVTAVGGANGVEWEII